MNLRLSIFIMFVLLVGGVFLYSPLDETTLVIKQRAPLSSNEITQLTAGVASVDITPPAGVPLNGHSSWSNISRGVRTHLYARAFYIRAPHSEPVAIVQLDLLSGESMLHHRVAEIIAKKTDIPAHRLNLSATHTHAGPGQYHSSNSFNASASNRPGFDPELFDFLASRIASAVIQAYESQIPAKIATGSRKVWGFTRNRALEPFVTNPEVSNKSQGPERKFYAIDPDLNMVRIDGLTPEGYKPLGAFATFAIHGTGVLSKSMDLYNGDIWAYISQEVQRNIEQQYNPPWQAVIGAFEGTHGDIAPNAVREKMGFMEAKRIGQGIGQQAWLLFKQLDSELTDEVQLNMGMREIDVLAAPSINGASLCDTGAYSLAQLAGPDEHISPVIYHLPPIKRGWPDTLFNNNCQAEKRRAGSFLQEFVFGREDFPHLLDVQLTRINDFLLLSLPFEFTVQAGDRIRQSLKKVIDEKNLDINYLSIGSVANGYFGYAVTPEEYKLQWYEGGSTIYGPETTPFLAEHSQILFEEILANGSVNDLPKEWEFVLQSNRYMPMSVDFDPERKAEGAVAFMDAAINQEAHWQFQFYGEPLGNIAWHESLIQIEFSTDGKAWQLLKQDKQVVNDLGYDISIRHENKLDDKGRMLYVVRWYNPELNPENSYRFVILPRERQGTLYSSSFN